MSRQPLGARFSSLADAVARALALILGLALAWYGLMTVLLAAKVDPQTVDSISGYRTAYEELAALGPEDVDGTVRAVAAGAGLAAFLLFGWLALRMLPRPYVARGDLDLTDGDRGATEVSPRALERVAESAALRERAVASAGARWSDESVDLGVSLRGAGDIPDTLRSVRARAREALGEHGLPVVAVHVTLTGFESKSQRRELS
jgi:hypothetical protein